MIPLSLELVDRLGSFLWPLLRISAFLLSAPPISGTVITVRIRSLIALVLTLFVYPLHEWPAPDPMSAEGIAEALNQVLIGLTMGLMLQIVVAALVLAGQAISAGMGLSMANMIDPNVGNVPVLSQFLVVVSTLMFVGFGGHTMLFALVASSFESLPIGTRLMTQPIYAQVVQWSALMFSGGLMLALPVIGTLLFLNVGLGVVTRAAPSLNIFSVGFPATILIGFLALIASMDSITSRIGWLWQQSFLALRNLLALPNG